MDPGEYMACLHVKRNGSATGSIGNIRVKLGKKPWGTVSWNTPYNGANGAHSDDNACISVVGDQGSTQTV